MSEKWRANGNLHTKSDVTTTHDHTIVATFLLFLQPHSLTHSLTHARTHSLTHSLTRSLTPRVDARPVLGDERLWAHRHDSPRVLWRENNIAGRRLPANLLPIVPRTNQISKGRILIMEFKLLRITKLWNWWKVQLWKGISSGIKSSKMGSKNHFNIEKRWSNGISIS